MSKKKKETVELRYYDIPQGDAVITLLGDEWVRVYGGTKIHLHFHNLFEIGICRWGEGTLQLEEEVMDYHEGMITMIPKNYPHTTTSEEPCFWEYIFFDPESILNEMYKDNELKRKKILSIVNRNANLLDMGECSQAYQIAITIMEEMRTKREFYQDTVRNLANALVLEIARVNTKSEDGIIPISSNRNILQVKPALDYISASYSEQMKIEDLARVCNMSETHFRRLFCECMNMTPVDYINMVRVQKACDFLRKTSYSMDEIAEKAGFQTASTFNRNFKKLVGTTPYQWKMDSKSYESKLLKMHISAEKGWE